MVHLFFYDFVDGQTDYRAVLGDRANVPGSEFLNDVINDQYKLLFIGELQGISFQKGANGDRAIVLNCVDLSNYWDTTYQYNFKGSLFGGRRHAAFIGANANFFTSPLGHGVGTIAALLNGSSVNYPELKGLLAGIVRVLEAIGGSYYGDTTFRGANDFTSIAELRLKILQQITAAEKDSSTRRLFARKAFNMWMNRQMGSLGKLVTFRGVVNLLQQFIFHEIYPCPAARFVPKESGQRKRKAYSTKLSTDPNTRSVYKDFVKLRELLGSAKENLQFVQAKTESSAKHQYARAASQDFYQAEKTINSVSTNFPRLAAYKQVPRYISAIKGHMDDVWAYLGDRGPGRFFKQTKIAQSFNLNLAISALDKAQIEVSALLTSRRRTSREFTYDKLERLNNQILRPDIWFAPAPRCNVLFPELYNAFQWGRNYFREVSRLELQTTNEILGDDALFNGRYYAPNVADMRSGIRLSSRKFGRLTLNHELMTGIIPMFEKLSEANLFAMKSRQIKSKGAKVGYAQRAVNFQYFKHRFASRNMASSGRFNPWFVPGFPSVLIDRTMDSVNLAISGRPIAEQLQALDIIPAKGVEVTRAALLQQLIPVQYVGSCTQLTHTVTQAGGSTNYAFAQARTHREDTEFLGVDKATISKKIGSATSRKVYAGENGRPPRRGNRGPRGGRITAVQDVTSQYLNQTLPDFRSIKQLEVTGTILSQVGAYRITESYTRRARVKIDLPIEEAIRPPWIWDGWQNLNIGETYFQFFGINSITDVDGYTSRDLADLLVGSDSLEASLEVKEGLNQGSGRKRESNSEFIERLATKDEQDKPRRNVPSTTSSSIEESADEKVSAATIFTIEEERTIENAIDYLVRIYSYIKNHNLDVGNFVRNYGWRPIATMTEILGSADFTITENPPGSGTFETTGEEGFHSRAFGDDSDLFGLVNPKVTSVLGLTREKREAAIKLDVRARRREAVWDYVNELTNSRGLLG